MEPKYWKYNFRKWGSAPLTRWTTGDTSGTLITRQRTWTRWTSSFLIDSWMINDCQTDTWFDGHEGSKTLRQEGVKMHPALADIYDAGCNVRWASRDCIIITRRSCMGESESLQCLGGTIPSLIWHPEWIKVAQAKTIAWCPVKMSEIHILLSPDLLKLLRPGNSLHFIRLLPLLTLSLC